MVAATEALRVDLVDVLGARGTGGEPAVLGHDLEPADGGPVAGSGGEDRGDPGAGQLRGPNLLGPQLAEQGFFVRGGGRVGALVDRLAVLAHEVAVQLAGVLPEARRDLGGQKAQGQAVLVGRPAGAVAAEERGPGALLSSEAELSREQPGHEPFEPHRHLEEPAPEGRGHPVDQAAAHEGLAHRGVGTPTGAVPVEVEDGRRQVVIGVHEPRARSHDPVPVRVGVVADRHLEPVLEPDEARHRVGGRAVHADLPVPVEGHEGERAVHPLVDHRQVEPMALRDPSPVGDAGSAQGVRPDPHPRFPDRVEIHDRGQVVHVRSEEVVAAGGGRPAGALVGDARDSLQIAGHERVGPVLDPARGALVGGPAVRRVVLDPAVVGRVVGGRDHDAVGQAVPAGAAIRCSPAPVACGLLPLPKWWQAGFETSQLERWQECNRGE